MRLLLLIISILLPVVVMAADRSMSSGSGYIFICIGVIIVIVSLSLILIRHFERRRFARKLDSELRPTVTQIITSLEDSLKSPDGDERRQLITLALKNASDLLSRINMDVDRIPAGDCGRINDGNDQDTQVIENPENGSDDGAQEEIPTAELSTPAADIETPVNTETDSIKIPPLDESTYNKAVDYVVSNIKRPDLSVEELSGHLGMSRVHLYKKLKATTGKTPIEFIRQIRLKRGAEMLLESKMTVSEVAFQLGYNNPKYFSKYFREEFGVLPSVYQSNGGKTSAVKA
ncbi:MAG: helix-turn-helix transcriptional regulator [Duncaniella sp.]|nr:helix-turn-helix transcriptional regulator [Duncaniella sp.]